MKPGPIHAFLQQDHARLALLLDAAASNAEIDLSAYHQFRAGLLRHIGMEEKILLPAVRKLQGGADLPVARQLKLDHAALAALLVPTPTHAIIGRIRALLAQHNSIEEGSTGLYAACEAIIGAEAELVCERLKRAPLVSLSPYRDGPKQLEAIERLLLAAGRQ